MKKSSMVTAGLLVIAAIFMAPINSLAYSFTIEGDMGTPYGYGRSFDLQTGVLTLHRPAPPFPADPNIQGKVEETLSNRFMIISDYNRPTHKVNYTYFLRASLHVSSADFIYGDIGSYSIYADMGLGTSPGTRDLLLTDTSTSNYFSETGEIKLFTNTWYYIWGTAGAEAKNIACMLQATSYLCFTRGRETAPTPIPGAVWLLGSGFIGLISLKKYKGIKPA